MGILKVEDEHQAAALALSSFSKSCSGLVEINQKGSDHGGYEESQAERGKTKKTVKFEEGSNQIIVFTSTKSPHALKKVVCICAPATHAGSFKCRLHRENSNHRFHGHRPSSSSSPRTAKHGGRGPKVFAPGKVSHHGGFGGQILHSRLGRAAMANVQKISAAVHQTQLH